MGQSKKRGSRLPARKEESLVPIWTVAFFLLYLLITGPQGYSGISSFKTIWFYVLTAPLLIYSLFRLFRDKPKRLSPMQIAALCYLGFTLLSAACSPYGADAWYSKTSHEGAVTVALYVLLYLCVAHYGRYLRGLGSAVLAASFCFCLLSVLQLNDLNPFGIYPGGLNYHTAMVRSNDRFLGTIGNVDLVSTFLCAMIALLVFLAVHRKGFQRWTAVCVIPGGLFLLIAIDVLCGVVGVAAGALVCLLVFLPVKPGHRRWLVLGAILLGVLVLVVLRFWDPPVNLFHEIHEILNGRITDKMGTGRVYIWRQMLERVPDRLLVGTGPDTVRLTGLEPFTRYDESGALVAKATITDGHCLPIHILYCQGLPALLSWLTMVVMGIVTWMRGKKNPAVAAIGAALVCWLTAMLFSFSSVIIQPFFWLGLGLMEAEAAGSGTASKLKG